MEGQSLILHGFTSPTSGLSAVKEGASFLDPLPFKFLVSVKSTVSRKLASQKSKNLF